MSVDLTLWEVWPIKAFIGAINKISTESKHETAAIHLQRVDGGVLINTVSQPDAEVSSSQSWKANPDVDTNRESNEPRERREEKTTGLSDAVMRRMTAERQKEATDQRSGKIQRKQRRNRDKEPERCSTNKQGN